MPNTHRKNSENLKTAVVTANLTPEIRAKIKAKADAEDRTVAYVVRRMILDGLGLKDENAR